MKQKDPPSPPHYYNNPAGLPKHNRFGAGQFGDTELTVVKIVNYKLAMSGTEESFSIQHNLNGIFDFYGTYKIGNDLRMLPDQEFINALPTIGGIYVTDNKPNKLDLFAKFASAQTLDIKIIFTDYDLTR